MRKSKWGKFAIDIYNRFLNDDLLSTGAQVSFYLLLSLFPFLIFLITLASYTSIVNVQDNLKDLANFLPKNAYQVVMNTIKETVNKRSGTLLSFGMIITIWSSSSGVSSLIRGINRAYDQEETRPFWKVIGVSLFFTIEIAVVISLTLILIVFGRMLGLLFFKTLGFSKYFLNIWNNVRHTIALAVTIIVLVSLYRNTPNHRLKIREVLPGSVFATLGWVIISMGFSYYANNFNNYSRLYGSLGGIIALLMWLYFSSIIILLGAEINASFHFNKIGRVKSKFKRF